MISRLSLKNFRNFENFSLTDITNTTIFIGPNGVGKTNILEAIALLGGYTLRRKRRTNDLIKTGQTLSIIEGEIVPDPHIIRVAIKNGKVQYILDDSAVRATEILGKVPSISFTPETVQLFVGDPSQRRTILDRVLSIIFPEYYQALSVYQQTLRQRNAALRLGQSAQLSVWEAELSRHAALIIIARHWLLTAIQKQFALPNLIEYLVSPRKVTPLLSKHDSLNELVKQSAENIQEFLREKWQSLRERELRIGFTLMGPQRDDWKLEVTFKGDTRPIDVGVYASRGQQRLAVIHLQEAILKVLHDESELSPAWLLDDVFSELDEEHQQKVVTLGRNYQLFVTTTNKKYSGITSLLQAADTQEILLSER
jgi:DNA replication and repair protein RecF